MKPEEIEKLPIIENWYMLGISHPIFDINKEKPCYDPRIIKCMFCGIVYNHPGISDGITLSTGKFKKFIARNAIETNLGYHYRLGKINKIMITRCSNLDKLMIQWADEELIV